MQTSKSPTLLQVNILNSRGRHMELVSNNPASDLKQDMSEQTTNDETWICECELSFKLVAYWQEEKNDGL